MKCSFCGKEFDADQGVRACRGCSLFGGGCKKVKCPHCGYEMPREPGLIRWIKNKFGKSKNEGKR